MLKGVCLRNVFIVFVGCETAFVSGGANVWESSGPVAPEVREIAATPSRPGVLYLATWYSGLNKSTDYGGSWSRLHVVGDEQDSYKDVNIDPANPDIVYAAGTWGPFKSTDAGASWSRLSNGLPGSYQWLCRKVAVDPAESRRVFAFFSDAGLYRSTDSGGNWAKLATPWSGGTVQWLDAVAGPTTTIYVGISGQGVFRSGDGGDTWTSVMNGLSSKSVYAFAADPSDPGTVYTSIYGNSGNVYRSTDKGDSWQKLFAAGSTVYAIQVHPKSPQTFFVGTASAGVLKTTDAGGTWVPATTGIKENLVGCLSIDPAEPSYVYAGYNTFSRSTDAGANWKLSTTGMRGASTGCILADPATPGRAFAGTSGGIFRTDDGASSWSQVEFNTSIDFIAPSGLAMKPTDSNVLFDAPGFQKTTDGGGSWEALGSLGQDLLMWGATSLVFDPSDPNSVFLAGQYHSYSVTFALPFFTKSTDGGATWAPAVTIDLEGRLSDFPTLSVSSSSPNTLYVHGYFAPSSLFHSTDGGTTWSGVAGLPADFPVSCAVVDPLDEKTVYVAGASFATETGDSGFVFKTTDGGATWFQASEGLPPNNFSYSLAIDPFDRNVVYASTGSGLFRSPNGGGRWLPCDGGLRQPITCVTPDPTTRNRIYAGVDGYFPGDLPFGVYSIQILFGDLNADGVVDAADQGLLSEYLAGQSDPFTSPFVCADMDGDGRVTAADLVLQKLVL